MHKRPVLCWAIISIEILAIASLIILPARVHAQNENHHQGWPVHTIDSDGSGADGTKLADLNHDGLTDIVTGWEESGITRIYLHPDEGMNETWPSVMIGETPSVEDAVFTDLDHDGNLEIITCTEKGSEKVFLHWNPAQNFLQAEAWKQAPIPCSENLMMWMYAIPADIDGKASTDVIAAGKGENAALGWFEVPEEISDLKQWRWHQISPVGWVMSIIPADMDHDGDMDVIISDRKGDLRGVRWLENPGIPSESDWQSHMIGGEGLEVMFISFFDLNQDEKPEVIISERTRQTIRICYPLDDIGLRWQENTFHLPENTGSAKSVEAGDINGDGVPDLVISTNTNGKEIPGLIWLDGNKIKNPQEADFLPVSGAHNAKYDKVELIDMDQDGDLDILICEENYGPDSEGLGVVWYENILSD